MIATYGNFVHRVLTLGHRLDTTSSDPFASFEQLELKEEKADAQRRMSWVSILAMLVSTIALFSPIVSDARVAALADLLGLFYVSLASIVGFYFGAQAYMSKK